jgi:hypothetical protein
VVGVSLWWGFGLGLRKGCWCGFWYGVVGYVRVGVNLRVRVRFRARLCVWGGLELRTLVSVGVPSIDLSVSASTSS